MELNNKYETVIGLEVHAQLLTKTKMFCGDDTSFGSEPNTNISPVSLGHPGTLPLLNAIAVEYAVKLGLALNCSILRNNYFARKNYFYPDLPKGYQLTQHTAPVCQGGYLTIYINGAEKKIRLNRIHMEEDAGKSLHDIDSQFSCIDFNRAGVPLLEIVTEPDLNSGNEAYNYLTELRRLVRWLGICDGNMEEGSMRCDANISVRLKGESRLGTRVEVKNLNSIRNVKRAIEIETARLINIIANGEKVIQETRGFDADNNNTFPLRSKEEADDYRYFPEPDLPPVKISDEFIARMQEQMPLLPEQLKQKYISAYLLNEQDATSLVSDKETTDFYEELVAHTDHYKAAANWLLGPVRHYSNQNNITLSGFPVSFLALAELISLVESGKVNFNNASTVVLQKLISDPGITAHIALKELNLLQESDTGKVEQWVEDALTSMPEKVIEYRKGKKGLQGLFAGEVKKLSKGKADMALVNKLLLEKLNQK